MSNRSQLLSIHTNKNRVSNSRQHIPRINLTDNTSFASNLTLDFRTQSQRDTHRCRFDELDAKVASDSIDAREAPDFAVFRAVVISHRRPV